MTSGSLRVALFAGIVTAAGAIGCDSDGDSNAAVTAYDGVYMVTLVRSTGETADVCFTIADGAFAVSGTNSAGAAFSATGTVNKDGDFIVNAELGDTLTVGIAASIDDNGAIQGSYSLYDGAAPIGDGSLSGGGVTVCPAPPIPPGQGHLSDHYGVRVTVPLSGSVDFKVTSYNVGLAPTFVPLIEERTQPLLDAIKGHDADVICLQEVWLDSHVTAFKAALQSSHPHTYSVPAEQRLTDGAACTTAEVQPMRDCLNNNCGTLSGDAFTGCAIDKCASVLFEIQGTNAVCGAAIIAQVGTDDIDAAIAALTKPAPLFAFDGATGVILASKTELKDTQVLDFIDKSTSNHRAALFGTVTIDGADQAVGCTHLTANLGASIPYTGPFASWEEEGNKQVEDLITFAGTYAGTNPVYLAGDFNCSLASTAHGVEADFAANCQKILDAGYESAAMDQLSCSFCEANSLNTASGGGEGDLLLDHVFTKNTAAASSITAEIVYDQPVTLP